MQNITKTFVDLMSGRKVGKRKFSCKYRKTTEIISKVTVSLSLTNSSTRITILILLFEFSKLLV